MRGFLGYLSDFLILIGNAFVSVARWLDLDFYEVGLVVSFITYCVVLIRLDRENPGFLRDLFTHGDAIGKADIFKLFAFGAFLVHSLVVWRQEVFGHLTGSTLEWYAGIWSGVYIVLKGFQTWKSMNGGQAAAPPMPPPQQQPREG